MAKAKIMVVEDEAITAKDIQNRLKDVGYDAPAVAASGEEAIKKVEEIKPDLVLMDIVLKGDMDGIEAAEQIRDRFDIPVVYLTAYIDEARLEKTRVTEPYGYIIKPCEEKELRPVIEMALQRHKQEKALRESEEKYRSLVTNLPDVTWTTDNEGNTTFVSPNIEKVYGYTPEEICKAGDRFWFGRIYPDDVEKVIEAYKVLFEKKEKFDVEYRIKRKDGKWIWLHDRAIATYEKGGVVYADGIFSDITERKLVKNMLREEKKFSDRLVSSMKDGFSILDNNGVHINVNKALCQITGFTREELIGTGPPHPYWPEEEYENIEKAFQKTLLGDFNDLELIFKRKNGERFPVIVSSSWLKDNEGNIISYFATVKDITEIRRTEDLLRTAEQDWRTSFNSLDDVMLIIDRDYTIENINEIGLKLLGKSKEELIGQKCYQVISGADSPGEDCPCRKSLETKKVESTDRYEERFGKYYSVKSAPIFDEHGAIIKFVDLRRDITERKQAEEKLRKNEAKFRVLLENLPQKIFLKDKNSTYISCNENYSRDLRINPDEIAGKTDYDFFPKELAEKYRGDDERIMELGRTEELEERYIQDGQEVWVSTIKTPVKDKKGNTIGIFGIFWDITERKRAEDELHESTEKIRGITTSAQDAIIMVNTGGNISYWNEAAERIFGYAEEEIIGKHLHETIAPERFHEDFFKGFKRFQETGQGAAIGKTLELAAVKKDGTEFPVELSLSAIRIKGKWNAIGIIRDISERKKREEELNAHREHIKLINKILRHDIINDLSVIKSALRLYESTKEEELLAEASAYVNKSVELINRMRELESFISSHRDLELYSVTDVCKKVLASYPAITFNIEGEGQVLADESLSSVIDNIIRNAVVHGKTDRIDIKIGERGEYCEIRIADHGVGIPDEIKEQIFEESFAYGETGGTGLGLHIVKKAMETYDGHVHVEDNTPRGAVFVLALRKVR